MLENLKRKSKKDTYFLPNWIEKNQEQKFSRLNRWLRLQNFTWLIGLFMYFCRMLEDKNQSKTALSMSS